MYGYLSAILLGLGILSAMGFIGLAILSFGTKVLSWATTQAPPVTPKGPRGFMVIVDAPPPPPSADPQPNDPASPPQSMAAAPANADKASPRSTASGRLADRAVLFLLLACLAFAAHGWARPRAEAEARRADQARRDAYWREQMRNAPPRHADPDDLLPADRGGTGWAR